MPDPANQVIGLYRRHAAAWAAARAIRHGQTPMEAAWLDRFLALLPQRPAVLDLGCGSGEPIACYLAAQGCAITGVDSAPEMVALCQARLPDQVWQVADMRALALGRVFDGILAWDSVFHLCPDDQRRMIPLFRTHAAPGAALMFTSGPEYGTAIGTFEGDPLYHASLSSTEYRTLLAQHGFDVIAHAIEDPACGRHTVWLARRG